MHSKRYLGVFCALGLAAMACGATNETDSQEQLGSVSSASQDAKCGQAEPHDILISELFYDSVITNYSLTKLFVDGVGNIDGTDMPDLVAGQVGRINMVAAAKADVADALDKVTGLPAYTIAGYTHYAEACTDLEALTWDEEGELTTTLTDTDSFEVTAATNYDSWADTHKEFGKVCPLVKRVGTDGKDTVDPPCDGSTNDPPSSTVSATGVVANAFGNCLSTTPSWTPCKLYYATGVNWTGRVCLWVSGVKQCVLRPD